MKFLNSIILLASLACTANITYAAQPTLMTQEEVITPFLMNQSHCPAYLKESAPGAGYDEALKGAVNALESIGVVDTQSSLATLCVRTDDFRKYEAKYWADLDDKKGAVSTIPK